MSENNLPRPPDDPRRLPIAPDVGAPAGRVATLPPAAHAVALPQPEPREDDDEIDLRALWQLLVKRRWLILSIIAAVVAIALVRTLLMPSIYRATAVLEIDPSSPAVLPGQLNSATVGTYDPDFQDTQIELLKGRALSQRVAENLGLVGSNILQQLQPPSWWQRFRGLLGPRAANASSAVISADRDSQPPPTSTTVRTPGDKLLELRRMTKLIQGGLVVDPVRGSNLVQVHYDSTSPQFSAKVANAVADGFIQSSIDREFGASSYAKKYLEDKLAESRSRLEQSERKLVAYAQQQNLVPASSGQSLTSQNLTDLNASLAAAQGNRIKAEALWNEVKSATGSALPADVLNSNPVLATLRQQRAQLMGQYQQNLQTFKPEYPSMLALKKQIDEVDTQIDHQLASIRASVKAEFDAAASQEKMLQAQLASLRTQTLDVESRSIRYNILKRDVDTNREMYQALLQRYKQVSAASGVRPNNISVVDRAEAPMTRYSPSLTRNAGVGLILGLVLGVGAAWLLERLDDTLKTPADLEQQLHLAVLGIVPKLVKQTPAEALLDPRSGFSESYRSVRTALQFSTERGVPNVLLVTSPAGSEGKSTTALTLARNFAQLGKHVLLIEGDLRNPSLGKTMDMAAEAGLSNLLAGAVPMAKVVLRTDDANLDVILAGALPPSPTELLAGHRLVSLLMTGAQKYDQIIIDGPPVLGIADAPILANVAAGTLLVIKARSTRISAAQTAIKRLVAARARLIGGLLTQYDARAGDYGYYGGYYGYYGYGTTTPQLNRQ